jgi:hypothetical protein
MLNHIPIASRIWIIVFVVNIKKWMENINEYKFRFFINKINCISYLNISNILNTNVNNNMIIHSL